MVASQTEAYCYVRKTSHNNTSVFEWYLNYGKKFKQWWSVTPAISTKRTITCHINSLNTKKYHDINYDVRNCYICESAHYTL